MMSEIKHRQSQLQTTDSEHFRQFSFSPHDTNTRKKVVNNDSVNDRFPGQNEFKENGLVGSIE